MKYKFSVIVPIYNVEEYLEKCLDSVLNQKYQNFELILVIDGSTDKSIEICSRYSGLTNKIIIVNKENGGLVSARKAGLLKATGDYIVPLDGDDWLHENFLLKANEILESTLESIDLICFGYYYAFPSKNKPVDVNSRIGLFTKKNIQEELYSYLVEDNKNRSFSPNVWAKVYNANIYKTYQNLVDDRINIGEDWACTKPIIYYSNNIYVSNEHLYFYRQNDKSMTKAKKEFDILTPFLIKNHFEIIFSENTMFESQINRNLIHNLFNVFLSKFRTNKKYSVIKREILDIINRDEIKTALRKGKFRFLSPGWIAHTIIKYKFIFFIKLIYILSL